MTRDHVLRQSIAIMLALLALAAVGSAAPPPNDACVDAIPIRSLPFEHIDPNVALATDSPDDPIPSCAAGQSHQTTWYTTTFGGDGRITLYTLNFYHDSVLWVGEGDCGALREVACDDDSYSGTDAGLTFLVEAGKTYYIMVGARFPMGAGELNMYAEAGPQFDGPRPPNDECTAPTALPDPPARVFGTGNGARESLTDLDPPCWPGATSNTIWFSYTSPIERQVRVDSGDSSEPTWLTVATGSCGNLVPIDCDRESAGGSQGLVDFLAEAGTTYYIQASRVFPPKPGDEVILDISEGQSVPVRIHATDASSGADLANVHVQLRDTLVSSYLSREGVTGADGRLTLYPPGRDTFDLQLTAQGHRSSSAWVTTGAVPLEVEVALEPMAAGPVISEDGGRVIMMSGGLSFTHFRPDGSDRREVRLDDFASIGEPTWSPDGTQIAFAGYGPPPDNLYQEIWIVGYDGSGAYRLTDFRGAARASDLTWSPDGSAFAFEDDNKIWTVDAATGSDLRAIGDGRDPAWSPDSSLVAYLGSAGIGVMHRDGSNRATVSTIFATSIDWSPSGSRIVASNRNESIWVVNLNGGDPVKIASTFAGLTESPVFSPDGCQVIYQDLDLVRYNNIAAADSSGFHGVHRADTLRIWDWSFAPAPDGPGDYAPTVDLTAPDGGELLEVGTTYTIRWDATDDDGIFSVDLSYVIEGVETPIVGGLAGNMTSYEWMVPNTPTDAGAWPGGATVRIVVRDAAGQEHSDVSRHPFSIAGPGDDYHRLALTEPAPGSSHLSGDTVRIAWNSDLRFPWPADGFRLELSTDGGASYRTSIVEFLPSTERSYDWILPPLTSGQAYIRLRQGSVYDVVGPLTFNPDAVVWPTGGGGGGGRVLLLGVRVGAGADFTWTGDGEVTNVHRTDTKQEIPLQWSRAALAAGITTGEYTDSAPPPAPGTPWMYQVYGIDCAGSSRP